LYDSAWKGEDEMKHIPLLMVLFLIVFLAGSGVVLGPAGAEERNLGINKDVTAKIRGLDRAFFQGFDVYSAGEVETPTALLFDIKDDYHLPSRFWGKPLTEEKIIYAIHRLDDQYVDRTWDMPFEPRALNIVNRKGEVLGYVYTGKTHVKMDRREDGQVTVFRPAIIMVPNWDRDTTVPPNRP
jgi:hypothetical protein